MPSPADALSRHQFILNKTVGFDPHQVEQTSKYLPEINAVLGGVLDADAYPLVRVWGRPERTPRHQPARDRAWKAVAAASAARDDDQQGARRPHYRECADAEALDALRCAVVLTNEHGAILHANRLAEGAALFFVFALLAGGGGCGALSYGVSFAKRAIATARHGRVASFCSLRRARIGAALWAAAAPRYFLFLLCSLAAVAAAL